MNIYDNYSTVTNTHGNIFLFPKEAHSDVVPEWRGLRDGLGGNPVLGQGHIKVLVALLGQEEPWYAM